MYIKILQFLHFFDAKSVKIDVFFTKNAIFLANIKILTLKNSSLQLLIDINKKMQL
jgi:hypothetical protein